MKGRKSRVRKLGIVVAIRRAARSGRMRVRGGSFSLRVWRVGWEGGLVVGCGNI